MGQADKVWSVLVMPLARRTEEWWGSVMDVGLDLELIKWSVHPGPVIVLTGELPLSRRSAVCGQIGE